MASKSAVAAIFNKLDVAGVAGGPKNPDDLLALVEDWVDVLPDVSDEDLAAAYRAYRRDAKACQFWPQPGTLIGLIPSRQIALIDDADEMFTKATRYLIDYQNELRTGVWPDRWKHPRDGWTRARPPPEIEHTIEHIGYVAPPWPAEKAEAVNRALAAMGGLEAWSKEDDPFTRNQLEKTWKAVYRSVLKGEHLSAEGAVVRQITSAPKQIERSP